MRRDAVIDNDATMKIAPGLPPWRIGSFRLATVGLEVEDPGVSADRAIKTWLKLQESPPLLEVPHTPAQTPPEAPRCSKQTGI